MIHVLAALAIAVSAQSGAPAVHAARSPAPPIVKGWIPFGPVRKRQMAAYAKRHYGTRTFKLVKPRVLVEHWTQNESYRETWNLFARDVPDVELHELPSTCAHFVVDRNGRIHQLVPLGIMCRHTVGLNDRAIGVENVATSDGEVMNNEAQRTATIRLARWVRCRFGIRVHNIIGHNESLRSPFHHERVRWLRTQTHDDMRHSTMNRFRRIVARVGC